MFPMVQPRGAVVRCKAARVPKKQRWAHILPGKLAAITEKVQLGWDVAYVENAKNGPGTNGWDHEGH